MTEHRAPSDRPGIRRYRWIVAILAVGVLAYALDAFSGLLGPEAVVRRSTLLISGSLASQSLSTLARRRSGFLEGTLLVLGMLLLVWTIVEISRGH